MNTKNENAGKKGFTKAQKKILKGASQKIAVKRGCSSMYVRHIINGKRSANTALAQAILKDLHDLLVFFTPVEDKDEDR